MGDRFSVNEEVIREAADAYGEVVDEAVDLLEQFYEGVREVTENTRYGAFDRLYNICAQDYNEQLIPALKEIFEDWRESSGSLESAVKKVGAGESAEEYAREAQEKLFQTMDDLLKELDDYLEVDTSEFDVSIQDFEEISDLASELSQSFEELSENTSSLMESKEDDNLMFSSISVPVTSSMEAIAETIKNIEPAVMIATNELAEKLNMNKMEAEAIRTESRNKAIRKTSKAFDKVSRLLD